MVSNSPPAQGQGLAEAPFVLLAKAVCVRIVSKREHSDSWHIPESPWAHHPASNQLGLVCVGTIPPDSDPYSQEGGKSTAGNPNAWPFFLHFPFIMSIYYFLFAVFFISSFHISCSSFFHYFSLINLLSFSIPPAHSCFSCSDFSCPLSAALFLPLSFFSPLLSDSVWPGLSTQICRGQDLRLELFPNLCYIDHLTIV